MNLLQLGKATPFTQGIGITGDNYEMLKRLATNRGAPAMQQNGMGNQVQTPVNANYSATNGTQQYIAQPGGVQTTQSNSSGLPQELTETPQTDQSDPKQVSDFANSLYSSLGKGFTYTNPTAGGSAIDQLSALQAQQANDKVNRTGMYAIDKNAGFSPAQVNAQEGSADQFYTEQKGKYGAQAQKELQSTNKNIFNDMTSGQASLFNSIVGQYNRSPLVQALDRTPVLKGSIDAIRKNPSDGATQLNLTYSYIQALDTYQSAVREGELALVNSIDSKIGALGNFITQIQNGQIVRPEVANQIADAAENIVKTIEGSAARKAKSFESQANTVGLGDAWKQYTGGFDQGFGAETDSVDIPDNPAPGTVWQAPDGTKYEFKNGVWDESFKSVGNTQVSIPKSSRISYVNNNPGNLVYAGQEGAKRGEKRSDGTYWAKFSTPDAGFNALQNQVKLDASRGLTLNSFINKYAPSSENDTKTYVTQVSQRLGVDPRTPISQIDTRELAKEIARKESNARIS